MKLIQLALTTFLIWFFVGAIAQESLMPYPKKQGEAAPSNSHGTATQQGALSLPDRPQSKGVRNNTIPFEHQLHSPIRWYALENANNLDYWKHVNTDRIWLELELGLTLDNEEIAQFLTMFGLVEPVRKSMHPQLTNYYVFERTATTAEEVIAMAEAAREVQGVLFLEPSVIYKGSIVPNDPLWNQQWGPYVIYADEAWDYGTQGEDSWNVLAVLDDAIDWMHEDLFDQVWYGYDYGFNDPDPTLDAPEQTHGTHVTGIMSASNNNGVGVAGMCTDTVYFAKVTDNSYFQFNGVYSGSAIIDAMYDIGNIDRVFAINLSLGGGAPSTAAEQSYNFAWNNGKLPIAASGNESDWEVSYPAAYEACMAVGSIGSDGDQLYLANYSNYGSEQEVTAPGGDMNSGFGVISTMPGNEYEFMEGTSMACPHVAGLAGLMKSLNPDLTNVDVREIINSTCYDFGTMGWDETFGYGMVNAKLALDVALGVSSTHDDKSLVQLKLYPNPVVDVLTVHNENHKAGAEIEIFDINGKRVLSRRATSDIFQVNVSHLPSGVYIVHVVGEHQRYTERFVKTN